MSKLQWAAVATVLTLGIVSQIPRHDHEHMPGHEHELGETHQRADGVTTSPARTMEGRDALQAGRVRVLLDITGMT